MPYKNCTDISLKPIRTEDKEWVIEFTRTQWASDIIISRGKVHNVANLKGIIAYKGNTRVGIITYNIEEKNCEIITLNSLEENRGIGTLLLKEVEKIARSKRITRIWLITTNDNIMALQFYQKKSFNIKAIYPNIIREYRLLKPEIPIIAENGIEIRDEIELEKVL
jgi:GNAT superfamily N-acetyltransferase